MIKMAVASVEQLIQDLLDYFQNNPNATVEQFASQEGCSVDDVYEAYNTAARQVASQGGGQVAVQEIPHGASAAQAQSIIQENITQITNIDNSRTANVFGDNANIDQGDNTATDGGVVIDDSTLDDSNVNTGDRAVTGDNNQAVTGDVTAGDQGQNAINFGDDAKIAQQNRGDVTNTSTGDNTGGAGGTATTGAGGDATGGAATSGPATISPSPGNAIDVPIAAMAATVAPTAPPIPAPTPAPLAALVPSSVCGVPSARK